MTYYLRRTWNQPPSWIRHFEIIKCIQFLLKTRVNRGNRDRKIDLCIRMLRIWAKNTQAAKYRKKLTLLKIQPNI